MGRPKKEFTPMHGKYAVDRGEEIVSTMGNEYPKDMDENIFEGVITEPINVYVPEKDVEEIKDYAPYVQDAVPVTVKVKMTRSGIKQLIEGGMFIKGQIYELEKSRAEKILRNSWGYEVK